MRKMAGGLGILMIYQKADRVLFIHAACQPI